MTKRRRVYADFNNADAQGRIRLSCVGSVRDICYQGLVLSDGFPLVIHDEELTAEALARFNAEEHVWTAEIEPDTMRQSRD